MRLTKHFVADYSPGFCFQMPQKSLSGAALERMHRVFLGVAQKMG
jgi:hypothetical protein